MKIKHLLLIAMLAVPMVMSAQRSSRQETQEPEHVYGPYVTNSYADNWFVGINAGALYNAEGLLKGKLRNNLTPEVRAYFGKWIVPNWGFRIGYSGWASRNKNVSLDWFQLHYVHADVLWNWSNLFGGYKPRIYNAIPYVHGGVFIGKYGLDFGAGAGLLNDFRINDNWHVNIDLRATITHGKELGTAAGGKALLGDLSVGVTYHFDKATWDLAGKQHGASGASSVKPEDYTLLEQNNQALEQDNAQLKDDKAKLTRQVRDLQTDIRDLRQAVNNGEKIVDTVYVEKEKIVEKVVNNGGNGGNSTNSGAAYSPNTFYFNYAKKVLSQQESEHLKQFIKSIVDTDLKGTNKYVITGYADQKTGSKSANNRIALLRAKYIKSELVKAGVDADNIEVKAAKGVNLGNTATLSRAAVIEVK